MNSFLELAKKRFSVRAFKSTPVEDEKIALILEAAKVAPTARNRQPQKIYVVRSEENLKKLSELSPCIYGAPLVFMVGFDMTRVSPAVKPGTTFGDHDAAIVCTHMMLEAEELGLGSCWVGYFHPDRTSEAFSLPESVQLCALLPVGYPADDCEPSPKHTTFLPMEDIVEYL